VSIRNHQQAVVGEAQAAGLSVRDFGGPPSADEVAAAGQNLDSPRHVDDVDFVVGVDFDRSRLGEMAVVDASLANDFGKLSRWRLGAPEEKADAKGQPKSEPNSAQRLADGLERMGGVVERKRSPRRL
jgi:hypothetical protein